MPPRKKATKKVVVVAMLAPTLSPIQQMQHMLATVPTDKQQELLRSLSYTHQANTDLNEMKADVTLLESQAIELEAANVSLKDAVELAQVKQRDADTYLQAAADALQTNQVAILQNSRSRLSKVTEIVSRESDLRVDAKYHANMEANLNAPE
tara:strand:- start:1851 stop:2306 length:456 start_codon:yes stop_codon:yes gene_type:complete